MHATDSPTHQAMLLQEEALIREFDLGPATGEHTLVVGVQELVQVRRREWIGEEGERRGCC
jgi:hypothetical protein